MLEQIKQLEVQFSDFTQKVGELKGEFNTLRIQQETSETLIIKLKHQEEI